MFLLEKATEHMINALERHLTPGIAMKKDLHPAVHLVEYEKGTTIQHFKQIPDQLWFLHQGIAKECTANDNRLLPWVTWFWYPSMINIARHLT